MILDTVSNTERMKKMKKLLSLLVSGFMIFTLMSPVLANTSENYDDPKTPEQKENEFFANGTPITIEDSDIEGYSAKIVWNGGSQYINADTLIYGGTDTTKSNVHYASTSVTMNGGTVRGIIGGNKTTNEKNCQYSLVDDAVLDINGGTITLGLWGIDNQNSAFTEAVMKETNGYSYQNYKIKNLNVTIDGAFVNDFRGVTSYAYVENMNVTIGENQEATLGTFYWGTNGIIDNATLNLYSGEVSLSNSILRSMVRTKMEYNLYGGKTGDIYAGSYYPYEESAAGSNNWNGWGVGGVDYGFANEISINISKDVVYNDIISGFQYRQNDVQIFKDTYGEDQMWRIKGMNTTAPIELNLESQPSASQLNEYSVIDSKDSYVKTNWMATSISLDKESVELKENTSTTLIATILPNNTTDKTLTWSTNNADVAIVDQNGKVTAVASGEATITVMTSNGLKTECKVTVLPIVDVNGTQIDTTNKDEVQVGLTAGDQTAAQEVIKETVNQIKDVAGNEQTVVNAVSTAVTEGKDITTELTVNKVAEKDVASADVTAVETALSYLQDKAGATSGTVAQYLDINVLVKVDGTTVGELNQLSKEITVSIAIPTELQTEGRQFYVIRVHGDEITRLPLTKNADGTYSFKTDRFSTYALVYVDGATESYLTGNESIAIKPVTTPPTSGNTETTKPNTETPETSAAMFGGMFAAMAVLSAGIAVVLWKKRELSK